MSIQKLVEKYQEGITKSFVEVCEKNDLVVDLNEFKFENILEEILCNASSSWGLEAILDDDIGNGLLTELDGISEKE